jgi:type II secretory pathway pseudopilin PulG
MTLVEVMVSMTILLLIMAGLIATMIQSRRMTEGSIRQNMAVNIVTSFLEQMKGMANTSLTLSPIPTQDDEATSDPLTPSTGTPPALNSFTPGTTPSGCVDNLKDFPMYTSGSNGAASTWGVIWPGATSPGTTPYTNDLHLNIWVWVTDMSSGSSGAVTQGTAYSVTMIYTWRVNDGGRVRFFSDEVHTIISSVSAFN